MQISYEIVENFLNANIVGQQQQQQLQQQQQRQQCRILVWMHFTREIKHAKTLHLQTIANLIKPVLGTVQKVATDVKNRISKLLSLTDYTGLKM